MMNIYLDKMIDLRGYSMKINKKIIMLPLFFAAFIIEYADAKVRSIMTRRDFERSLSRGYMMVALFYEAQKDNKEARENNKELFKMYEDVSRYQPYDDADIIFVKVNIKRDDLDKLAALYGVVATPTFMFFKQGQYLVDDKGNPIIKEGFVSRADIQSVIAYCCNDEIKRYVAQKEKRRNQILEQENESWKAYYYPRDVFVRGYAPEEREENME